MSKSRESFHIVAKETCKCNINCQYCYDRKNRIKYKGMIASEEVVDHTAKILSEFAHTIDWLHHGGEPTTIPYEWFENLQDIFYKYYETDFRQSMQSNGVNLIKDKELLDKLHDLGIDVGISFDILTQSTRLGRNSEEIMEDYCDLLERIADYRQGVTIGALTVVTNKSINRLIEMYEYMKRRFTDYNFRLSWLFVSQHQEEEKTLEIPSDILMIKLREFYNYMFKDTSENAISEHDFEQLLALLLFKNDAVCCHFTDCRNSRLGLQPDGEVLYCDTVFERYPIGNVMDFESVEDILTSKNYIEICNQIQERFDNECSKCDYFHMCKGACNHMHMSVDGYINKCNPHVCNQVKERLCIVYECIQDVHDLNLINNRIASKLMSYKALLPKEVELFLKEVGIDIDITIKDISIDNLASNPRFKLFQLFNSNEPMEMTGFCSDERRSFFKRIYTENEDLIKHYVETISHVES